MLRLTGYPLMILAMVSIAGGHWAVLQSVAWAGMVVEYSKTSTLGAAVVKTFSGEAPCHLCKTIEAGKKQESRLPASVQPDKSADKFLSAPDIRVKVPPAQAFSYASISDERAVFRPLPPSAPVPIAA